jgi:hypothetical protein
MHINESGRYYQSGCINDPVRLPMGEATSLNDLAISDGNVSIDPGITGAIDDPAIFNEDISLLRVNQDWAAKKEKYWYSHRTG